MGRGQVSQSFQIAPFDDGYWPSNNSTANWVSYDPDDVVVNSYRGGIYQQALSHLAYVNDDGFVDGGGDFAVYGMSPPLLFEQDLLRPRVALSV